MGEDISGSPSDARVRVSLFAGLILVISLVMDGLPKAASPFLIQLCLLPITVLTLIAFSAFLGMIRLPERRVGPLAFWLGAMPQQRVLAVALEVSFCVLFFYETSHFRDLGYRLLLRVDIAAFAVVLLSLGIVTFLPKLFPPAMQLGSYLGAYVVGHLLAIAGFPLSYLRSDMLPVIFWADRAMLAGQNPYQHFNVADRIYDFPYLPGMLLTFAPAQALHIDLRWASIVYIAAGMLLVYWTTLAAFRFEVAVLIGVFVLCPYLQYRHELYTQGHFFSLILVFVLMQRRHFGWSAAVFGVSMVISQFSWVIFPFFLLNALRRGGWREAGRMALFAGATSCLLMLPFVTSGAGNIAHNAVGQWDRLERPIARPMNLSFWASYLVRPSHLKWVQLVLLAAIFGFCWIRGRCADLADMLRWMILALLVFILFNVLVDGYFYLMLLVPMLVYTCVANGWWGSSSSSCTPRLGSPGA